MYTYNYSVFGQKTPFHDTKVIVAMVYFSLHTIVVISITWYICICIFVHIFYLCSAIAIPFDVHSQYRAIACMERVGVFDLSGTGLQW